MPTCIEDAENSFTNNCKLDAGEYIAAGKRSTEEIQLGVRSKRLEFIPLSTVACR